MFQAFIKLQVPTSTLPTKWKGGHGHVLPSLSSDDDNDDHDEHHDATSHVPYDPITSTPTTPLDSLNRWCLVLQTLSYNFLQHNFLL